VCWVPRSLPVHRAFQDPTSVDLVVRDYRNRTRLGYSSASLVLLSSLSAGAAWTLTGHSGDIGEWLSCDMQLVGVCGHVKCCVLSGGDVQVCSDRFSSPSTPVPLWVVVFRVVPFAARRRVFVHR
jgi:hypothetical protein